MDKTGYFNDEKKEYIIENMYPLRPLKNYLWNDSMIVELNQFGIGPSKAMIDKKFRTVVMDERMVYIKDEKTGEIFDVNRNFLKKNFDEFRAIVGQGYHTIECSYLGYKVEFTILVPSENLVEMHRIKIKNTRKEKRRFSLYTYIRPFINITAVDAYGKAEFSRENNALLYSYKGFRVEQKYTDIFYSSSKQPHYFDLTDENFIGTYGSLSCPDGVKNPHLSCKNTVFEGYYAGAFQFDVQIEKEEEKEFYFSVGTTLNKKESLKLIKKYTSKESFENQLLLQREKSENLSKKANIKCPDNYLCSMVNIWLKRQMSLGKTWGRVYGKGFRDVMQDLAGFVSLDTKTTRSKILNALSYQFENGNAIRMFDPIFDYPYQDMPVWIPATILAYLKESGDFSILSEEAGYYQSELKENVFSHLTRGIDFLLNSHGKRGLNLWGGGDWNDSLDNCGMKMKGESVWLSIATLIAVKDYIEILKQCEFLVGTEYIKEKTAYCNSKTENLKKAIIKYGFEEDHFIYGYNDYDEKVGSYENKEGQIFLNVQTWAVMSDILTMEENKKLMAVVEKKLKCDYGYIQNFPPYETPDDHLGRLTYFAKGVYENGSVYIHGVMFKIIADCIIKNGNNALKTLEMLRYNNPLNKGSGVEPYAISNMYFGPSAPEKQGFAPQSWITGSAGWMYRAITEYIFGIKPTFDGIIIDPCMPEKWDNLSAVRAYRDVTYNITYKRSKSCYIEVDGEKIIGNKVKYNPIKSPCNITCFFK